MNSPYMGKFRVSQKYSKPGHTGLDLVGIDSKEIYSTVNGVVDYAGWENPNNHAQGFGQYVRIKDDKTGWYFYFGHLHEIKVTKGQRVKITEVIGVEGSTGYSTGSHCHVEARTNVGVKYAGTVDITKVLGILNQTNVVFDDGYRPKKESKIPQNELPYKVKIEVDTVLNIRESPNLNSKINKQIKDGVYTIVEESFSDGRLWGKLKSGAGWIALEYTRKM